jgi:hypothetical protein
VVLVVAGVAVAVALVLWLCRRVVLLVVVVVGGDGVGPRRLVGGPAACNFLF